MLELFFVHSYLVGSHQKWWSDSFYLFLLVQVYLIRRFFLPLLKSQAIGLLPSKHCHGSCALLSMLWLFHTTVLNVTAIFPLSFARCIGSLALAQEGCAGLLIVPVKRFIRPLVVTAERSVGPLALSEKWFSRPLALRTLLAILLCVGRMFLFSANYSAGSVPLLW